MLQKEANQFPATDEFPIDLYTGVSEIMGFVVVSKKQNQEFHRPFRSVPDEDCLIGDYNYALQRETLAHGHLYIGEGHICFYSNVFGWITTLVMSFEEIVSVNKSDTISTGPRDLIISTLLTKNIFTTVNDRDPTFDLIVGVWKIIHPSLRSSPDGVRLRRTGDFRLRRTPGFRWRRIKMLLKEEKLREKGRLRNKEQLPKRQKSMNDSSEEWLEDMGDSSSSLANSKELTPRPPSPATCTL